MSARLNVTRVERMCYSRRKLRALSALRNAGITPTFGMSKEYQEMGVKGKVYLVEHPDGTIYHFSRLADIHAYAADYRAFQQQQAITDWHVWRRRWQHAEPPLAGCVWPYCAAPATTRFLDDMTLCARHAFIYERALEERKKRRAASAHAPQRVGMTGA